MTFTHRRITPASRPSATTAIGVKTAISESEYFVTQVPTSQTTRTTTIIGITKRLSTGRRVPFEPMNEANYASGDEYVVEFLGYRFGFNADDFEERITAAAVRLGLIGSNDLDDDETADLVELAADGRIAEPRSLLGRYLVRHWERVGLLEGESLVYWLRKLVFRGAWLDHRVKEGLLEVTWDEHSGDFGYAGGALAHQHSLFRAIPGRGAVSFVPIDFTHAGDGFEPADYGREALIAALIAAAPTAVAAALAELPQAPDARRKSNAHILGYAVAAGASDVLPLTFRLVAGRKRPSIQIAHADGIQQWHV